MISYAKFGEDIAHERNLVVEKLEQVYFYLTKESKNDVSPLNLKLGQEEDYLVGNFQSGLGIKFLMLTCVKPKMIFCTK